jgi:TolB protein
LLAVLGWLLISPRESMGVAAQRDNAVHSGAPRLLMRAAVARGRSVFITNPAWSPDGHTIGFGDSVNDGRSYHLYVIDADGSGRRQVTFLLSTPDSPAFSPDGEKMAFDYRTGGRAVFGIGVVGTNGTGEHSVVRGGFGAVWSPRGSKFAYHCGSLADELCVVDGDGRDRRVLAHQVYSFAWSPDGTRIAYECGTDGNICVIGFNGRHRERLPTTTSDDSLAWSPGPMIASDCTSTVICAVNADGTGLRYLVRLTSGYVTVDAWSPSGRVLAFGVNEEIHTIQSDGRNEKRLTHGYSDDAGLTWSPDGRRIAFVRTGHGVGGLYVMNADGTNQVRITTS